MKNEFHDYDVHLIKCLTLRIKTVLGIVSR